MKIETGIANTKFYHSIRGAIDFGDRIKDSQEFLSEYFVEQFTKQISPKFAEFLGVNVTRLKRRDAEFLSNQYLNNSGIIFCNGVWYLKVQVLLSNWGAYFWCRCTSEENFDPWSVDNSIPLNFEIVFTIPDEVRMKNLDHLMKRIKTETDFKKSKELEKTYNDLIKIKMYDKWIERCKKILED